MGMLRGVERAATMGVLASSHGKSARNLFVFRRATAPRVFTQYLDGLAIGDVLRRVGRGPWRSAHPHSATSFRCRFRSCGRVAIIFSSLRSRLDVHMIFPVA